MGVEIADLDKRDLWQAVGRGALCRCPNCGKGALFEGFLRVSPTCASCGYDLSKADSGDGPAVFVILGLGAVMMMLVFWVEFRFEPPWWLHVILWVPFSVAAALWLLRLLKALLINQQYVHRSTALEE